MPTRLAIANHFLAARRRWVTLRGPALVRYQEQRARLTVLFALQRAPFYRRHWCGHALRDWRRLPLVNKALMMASFDDFNSQGISGAAAMAVALKAEQERDFKPTLQGLTVGLSSGTSGHRGLFVVSPQEQAAWAGTMLARMLHRPRLSGYRVAFFLRSNSNLYERLDRTLIQFRYFDLMLPLEQATAALDRYQPHIVAGPPSLLGMLAERQRCGLLNIHPERLVSAAEVLEPDDAARISAAFDAPVQQVYQCTEGLLAISCQAGGLHIQEDIVALQLEPLGSGRYTPVVTDLWRRTQPMIRYQLGDVVRLAEEPCSCGSPWRVLAAIEGRCDDVCYFEQHGGSLRTFFPDTIRRMVLLSSPDILDYRAIQERPGQLRILLEIRPEASFGLVDAALRAQTTVTLAQYDCRPAVLNIEAGIPPNPPGNKRRRVVRLG